VSERPASCFEPARLVLFVDLDAARAAPAVDSYAAHRNLIASGARLLEI